MIFFCLAIMVKIDINIPLYQTASRKGPLGGLEACFRKAKNPYCLVLGVDVPLVPEELAALIRQSLHSDAKQ